MTSNFTAMREAFAILFLFWSLVAVASLLCMVLSSRVRNRERM